MKALKPFLITFAIVITAGVLLLVGGSALGSNFSLSNVSTRIMSKVGSTKAKPSETKKKRAKANPVTKAIVKEAITSYANQEGGTTKKLLDTMSEEDKDQMIEIIASNVTLDSVSTLEKAASSDDPDAILNYVQDNFSEEDVSDLQDILEKYDAIP